MKKHTLQSFAAYAYILVFGLVASVGFVACSDDDGGEAPALSISALTPSTARIGESVTITGTGFSTTPSQNTVSFKTDGGTAVFTPVLEATATTLKVAVPAGAVTGSVTVTVGGQSAVSTQTFTLDESLGAPLLTSLSPTSGFVNSEVTITGTGFGGDEEAVEVLFGTVAATEISEVTSTTIKVKVPSSLSAGPVNVKVSRDGTTSTNTLQFTVDATPAAVKTVYWVDNAKIFKGIINESGIEIVQVYASGVHNPVCIAIDVAGGYVYWGWSGGISRAPLNGEGPVSDLYTDANKLFSVSDIAVDASAGEVYFSSNNAAGDAAYIHKGKVDGSTELTTLLTESGDRISFNVKLAIADNTLYWAEPVSQRVMTASLAGTFTPTTLFEAVDGLGVPVGIAFDKALGKIYITDNSELLGIGESKIQQGNLDGTGSVSTLVGAGSNVRFPYDAEIDTENGYFFWLNSTTNGGPASDIMRVKLDGTGVEKLFDGFNNGLSFDLDIR